MARKANTTELKIAQTFRAWERKFPNAPKRVRVAAFDRIADGLFAAKHVEEKVVSLIEENAKKVKTP